MLLLGQQRITGPGRNKMRPRRHTLDWMAVQCLQLIAGRARLSVRAALMHGLIQKVRAHVENILENDEDLIQNRTQNVEQNDNGK